MTDQTAQDRPTAAAFRTTAHAAIDRVADREASGVTEAAALITAALRAGGIVQAFGTGHSQALAMEIAGRAGGLVPTNMLALRDVVILGGEDPSVLSDPLLERDGSIAGRIYDLARVRAEDVFVIASNSGVNGAVVELASLVRQRGHKLIAITSMEHTKRVPARHPSGLRLCDIADVVLDNGAPLGDAVLPLPGGGSACGISSITAALLAQMIVAEVIGAYLEAGEQPPVYLSANIPGGDEHNKVFEDQYTGRIRRSA
jgi:uncharacterized phosphosugar-binding protein